MRTVEPDPRRLEAFLATDEADAPLVMLNLLRYRDQAEYAAGFDAEPCSGREAYQRYGAVAATLIGATGGRVLWMGTAVTSLISPDDEQWDDVLLVEYPSRAAFLEMVSKPEYQAVVPHRTAALLDSRLVASHTVRNAFAP